MKFSFWSVHSFVYWHCHDTALVFHRPITIKHTIIVGAKEHNIYILIIKYIQLERKKNNIIVIHTETLMGNNSPSYQL